MLVIATYTDPRSLVRYTAEHLASGRYAVAQFDTESHNLIERRVYDSYRAAYARFAFLLKNA